jgi:hypothetical protein
MSVLDTHVSWFHDYYNTAPGGTVSLLQWLQSKKLQQKVEAIRAMATKGEKDAAKSKLPAITPSGIFSQRNSSSLYKHSGLICIDIDQRGNEEIENYSDLKKELCKLKQVAYCGASVSGTGFFLLIPLAYPDKHKEQFAALKQQFWKWGIVIDKNCGNIDRLRGASFDADAYYNHDAIPFTGLPEVKHKSIVQHTPAMIEGNVFERARHYTEAIHRNKLEQGNKHWYILRIAEYLAANGIDEQTASAWIYDNVLPKHLINSNCISYPYQLQKAADDPPPPAPVPDGPAIGPNGYPASWDEPTQPINMAAIVQKFTNTGQFVQCSTNTQPTVETGSISPTDGINEAFTLDWFIADAKKWFSRSMVKNPNEYFAAYIASYRDTLRRVGIEGKILMDALIL